MEHVHEASKLLSKSIVRIEQPDIVLQEDDALLEAEVCILISFISNLIIIFYFNRLDSKS